MEEGRKGKYREEILPKRLITAVDLYLRNLWR